MPLYRIRIFCSSNPSHGIERPWEGKDLRAARTKAIHQLDYARNRSYVGRAYDSWRITKHDPTSGKFVTLASGKAS